jgi:hypothetical protein
VEPSLHPNLAKLAAAYDEICHRYQLGVINASQASAEIVALEARDDDGVRWSIDPKSGEWVRRTALGGVQADAPPQWGYQTPDAFDFTRDPTAFNPNDRISHLQVDESLQYAPAGLAGATRSTQPAAGTAGGWKATLARIPTRTKLIIVALAVVAGVAVTHHPAESATTPLPATPATSTTAPAPAP